MKTFYVMQDANWIDRRKGEIALKLIKLGIEIKTELVIKHCAKRLFRKKSRMYNLI